MSASNGENARDVKQLRQIEQALKSRWAARLQSDELSEQIIHGILIGGAELVGAIADGIEKE